LYKGKTTACAVCRKVREKEQKLNIREKVKRTERAHIKEHEKDRERTDRQRHQVKPNMNRAKE
jgi:hypothetical protein